MSRFTPRVLVFQDANYNFATVTIVAGSFSSLKTDRIIPLSVMENAFAIYSITDKQWIKNRDIKNVMVPALESLLQATWQRLPVATFLQVSPASQCQALACDETRFYCGPTHSGGLVA